MKIADKTITTPADNPLGYSLDWRYQIARAVFELPDTARPSIHDPDARALLLHMLRRQKVPLRPGEKPSLFDRVVEWQSSTARPLIEAFLVAASTYDEAAGDLGVPVKEITLYGQLFFDVRDDQGKVRPGILMGMLATTEPDDDPARLRRIALTGGIQGLRGVLCADVPRKEASLDHLVEAELTRRLHAGELRTSDLVRLQANAIARERIAAEQQDDSQPAMLQAVQTVTDLLALTKPRMVSLDRSPEQTAVTNQAIQSRLQAQRNIGATPVEDDSERGREALTEMMQRGFKG